VYFKLKNGFAVREKSIDTASLTAIVVALTELHEWELECAPLLATLTGRHLYYRIARRAVGDRSLLSRSLKDLMGGVGYTDKALRTRMRDLEKDGFVESFYCENDARSRYLMPTERFYESVYLHAAHVKYILEKNFLLIQK
jgi:hypothetical protein